MQYKIDNLKCDVLKSEYVKYNKVNSYSRIDKIFCNIVTFTRILKKCKNFEEVTSTTYKILLFLSLPCTINTFIINIILFSDF